MFINSILSNILYVYQSWKNLGTISFITRTGVISAIFKKKVMKKILQTTDSSYSSLDAIIFLFLNISYIILHNGHFRNLKTNQLLSKKNYITHTFYYTWRNWCLIHLANSSLWDWDFTFSALHLFGYGNKFISIVEGGHTNIQSKIKINGLLI